MSSLAADAIKIYESAPVRKPRPVRDWVSARLGRPVSVAPPRRLEDAAAPLGGYEHARVDVTDTDGQVHVTLRYREWPLLAHTARKDTRAFAADQVAQATALAADWQRRAETLNQLGAAVQQARDAVDQLPAVLEARNEAVRAALPGRAGVDYDYFYVRVGENTHLGQLFVSVHSDRNNRGSGYHGGPWLPLCDVTWPQLLAAVRAEEQRAFTLMEQTAHAWQDEQTQAAFDADDQRELADRAAQTAAIVRDAIAG